MFEYLKPYKYIFVSGMQRSGTTICMRMIQWDLEISHCYWLGDNLNTAQHPEILKTEGPIVFHSPAISRNLHEIRREDSAIIWMKRDNQEIFESSKSIQWAPGQEFKNYELEPDKDFRDLIQAKEDFWEWQKERIPHTFEVEYENLKSHPLWLEDRSFKSYLRATSPGTIPPGSNTSLYHYYPDRLGRLEDLLSEYPKN